MHYGLLAEFENGADCARAITKLTAQGYRKLDAHTPCPVPEVEAALGLGRSPLPRWVLLGALCGAGFAYLLLFWTQSIDYPLNVGGRPSHAAPAFVPIVFETAILFGTLTAFFGALLLAGLPRFWRPVFEIEAFARASSDRYFVALDASDERYEPEESHSHVQALNPLRVLAIDAEDS